MDRILLGKGDKQVHLLSKYGNRHGLVAGATGTGKTVSLMVLAEGFSRIGVPVFMADVKGDVSGLAMAGTPHAKIQERIDAIGITDYTQEPSPVVFWDLYGKSGHPIRTTISEMGPTLLSRILELNDTQSGILDIVFELADDQGLLLLDLDDLRAMLNFVADNRKEISREYGLVYTQSIAAIQRSLLVLERDGGEGFIGEPALELNDIMRTDFSGRGVINLFMANKLILKPRLYSTFLLWMLSELFENLPEVGDLDKPKLVFFFDEAHLLFNDAPPKLLEQVEQVVRLIRSKGVGIYFCSQFPDDVPGEILGQLGNRIQHALRAYTPRDQKAVRTAAQTFVANPTLNVAEEIGKLGVGEALVSTLQDKGVPMPVEKTLICPPRCRMGGLTPDEHASILARSPVGGRYDTPVDRESAHEVLAKRTAEKEAAEAAAAEAEAKAEAKRKEVQSKGTGSDEGRSKLSEFLWGTRRRQGVFQAFAKQTARTVGRSLGRKILRGILGSIMGSK